MKINEEKLMDEISQVLKRFGDEQSTLLDQFERLSFEVQLNQAILGRSLSEPGVGRPRFQPRLLNNGEGPPPLVTKVKQGRRRGGGGAASSFNKVLKKLLKPIFGRKGAKCCQVKQDRVPDPKNPKSWKALSRSLRL